ncbi:MAG TPA: hypothetical protein VKB93_02090 [Thermoanaerobaculia bacterium]|nr:hypothetical protein [Thermoanaerobaculia bacterium]
MIRRLFTLLSFLVISASARASCGSSSCPLDTNALNQPMKGQFTIDLSLQSIDQDQPRIGTHGAHVGEIHGPHHDEVRTMNRIATALLGYGVSDRMQLSVAIPYVSREHNHLASNHVHSGELREDHNVIPESWDLHGLGDVVLQARWKATAGNPQSHSGLWLLGGVKLPTGVDDAHNADGEAAEIPVQPGNGTTDGIAGLSYQSGFSARSLASGTLGNYVLVPWFVSATYQFRGGAAHGYRLGNELQLSGGGVYRLTSRFDALAQLNARIRQRDRIDGEPEEEAFTGSTFVYASPGLRFSLARAAVYALVQLPLYQRVNALQLTSKTNYVFGLQTRF